MSDRTSQRRRVRARRKMIAIGAAGAVLIAGTTAASLAAWIDEEWVTAGVDSNPGLSASEFEIEQQVATDDSGDWFNRETEGAAGVIDFDDVAQQLSPGAVAYGWVSLRAAAGSVGGDLALVSDYTMTDSELGDVLRYGARVHDDPSTCNALDYAGTGTVLVADASTLATGSGATTFELVAGANGDPGTPKTVCFRIEFPEAAADDDLQGADADVNWFFRAISK